MADKEPGTAVELRLSRQSTHQSNIAGTDDETSLWKSVRKWPRVLGYSLGLTSAILLYGFDTSIVGNVSAIPAFQHHYGRQLNDRYIIPSMWMGLWNAMSPVGLMLGSLFAGWFQDRVGRRPSLALGSGLSAVGVAVVYCSHFVNDLDQRRGTFLAGKVAQGLAVGAMLCTTQTYMSEILPPKLRGSVMAFFPVFILLGQLIGAVVVYASLDFPGSRSYTTPILSMWPFSAIPLIMAAVVPESPTYLLRKKYFDRAFRAQRRLDSSKTDTRANIDTLIFSLKQEEEVAKYDHATYKECFQGTNKRRTWIVIFANLLSQLFGLSLLADASYFIQVVGMSANNALMILQLGVGLGLLSNIASMWVLTKIGRRRLSLLSLATCAVLWLGMGIGGCFHGIAMIWYTAGTMMVVIVVVGVAVWPSSYCIGAETSSLRLRAKAQGIGWFCAGLAQGTMGISLPYAYNADEGNLRAKTGFIFAFTCSLAFAITWLCVPELKDRSPAEIDAMFEQHLSARQFKHWTSTIAVTGSEDVFRSEQDASRG